MAACRLGGRAYTHYHSAAALGRDLGVRWRAGSVLRLQSRGWVGASPCAPLHTATVLRPQAGTWVCGDVPARYCGSRAEAGSVRRRVDNLEEMGSCLDATAPEPGAMVYPYAVPCMREGRDGLRPDAVVAGGVTAEPGRLGALHPLPVTASWGESPRVALLAGRCGESGCRTGLNPGRSGRRSAVLEHERQRW